jgi:hypothetical protein
MFSWLHVSMLVNLGNRGTLLISSDPQFVSRAYTDAISNYVLPLVVEILDADDHVIWEALDDLFHVANGEYSHS